MSHLVNGCPVGENVNRQAVFCYDYSPEDKENGQERP